MLEGGPAGVGRENLCTAIITDPGVTWLKILPERSPAQLCCTIIQFGGAAAAVVVYPAVLVLRYLDWPITAGLATMESVGSDEFGQRLNWCSFTQRKASNRSISPAH